MTAGGEEDPRLARISAICLSLPEATRWYDGQHATYAVRKKNFAYFLDDHHGDGIVAFCCKVPLGENVDLVALDPKRFLMPAYVGARGWVSLRLDRGEVDWDEVAQLAAGSYQLVAPKRLAARARGG